MRVGVDAVAVALAKVSLINREGSDGDAGERVVWLIPRQMPVE